MKYFQHFLSRYLFYFLLIVSNQSMSFNFIFLRDKNIEIYYGEVNVLINTEFIIYALKYNTASQFSEKEKYLLFQLVSLRSRTLNIIDFKFYLKIKSQTKNGLSHLTIQTSSINNPTPPSKRDCICKDGIYTYPNFCIYTYHNCLHQKGTPFCHFLNPNMHLAFVEVTGRLVTSNKHSHPKSMSFYFHYGKTSQRFLWGLCKCHERKMSYIGAFL